MAAPVLSRYADVAAQTSAGSVQAALQLIRRTSNCQLDHVHAAMLPAHAHDNAVARDHAQCRALDETLGPDRPLLSMCAAVHSHLDRCADDCLGCNRSASDRGRARSATQQLALPIDSGGLGLANYNHRHAIDFLAGVTTVLRYARSSSWTAHRLPAAAHAAMRAFADQLGMPQQQFDALPQANAYAAAFRAAAADIDAALASQGQTMLGVLGIRDADGLAGICPTRIRRRLNAACTFARWKALHSRLADEPTEQARFLSASGNGAGTFLHALPTDPTLRMTNDAMTAALRLRLGLANPSLVAGLPEMCQHCQAPIDPRGHHLLVCTKGGGRLTRHNHIVDCLLQLAKRCGATSVKAYDHMYRDHSGLTDQPDRKLQPDLLIHGLPSSTAGRLSKFVDVTVHDPCNMTHLMRALRPLPAPMDRRGRPLPQQRLIGGGTAAAAEKAKHATAARNLGDHVCPNDFAAFGAEHFGALGPEASALLRQMAVHSQATQSGNGRTNWNAPNFQHYAAQAVSIALHSGVGRQLQMRASVLRDSNIHTRAVPPPPATDASPRGDHSPTIDRSRPTTPHTSVHRPQPTTGQATPPALAPARAGLRHTGTPRMGASNVVRRVSPPRDQASAENQATTTTAVTQDPPPVAQPTRKRRARSRSNGTSRRRWAQLQKQNREAKTHNGVPETATRDTTN